MNRFGSILQVSWDWRAAGNFMFGGTGSALMLMTAIASFPDNPPLPLGLSALAFVGLGLFMVWLEIGRPWRFLHVYFHPQTSWMTREASVAILLFPIAFIGIVFRIPALLAISGLLGFVFLYCQARILLASKGIPAWREQAIMPYIITTGLTEGTGMLLLATLIFSSVPGWALYLLIILLAYRIIAWNNYRSGLSSSGAPKQTLAILAGIHPVTLWLGNAVPFVLAVTTLMIPAHTMLLISIGASLAVLSGWHTKFTIVARAAQVQGYSLGKIQKGRPNIKPPVRRKPDKFVFDR